MVAYQTEAASSYKGSMMNRQRTDESLSFTKDVPASILQLLREQNARLGVTGPESNFLSYIDKTLRRSTRRETAWSLDRPDILEISRPLAKEVECVNKDELPSH